MVPEDFNPNNYLGPWANTTFSFWCVTIIVMVSAAVASFSRNIIHAAYSLFFTLIGMAGFYILLGADFVAIAQVVIYVGGILVLLMFGVLLTNRSLQQIYSESGKSYIVAGIAAAVFFLLVLARIIFEASWGERVIAEMEPTTFGIGRGLVSNYFLPFQIVGFTLLFCLVGAAVMVRKREPK